MCDYSYAYIIVKGIIDLLAAATNGNDKAQKDATFNDALLSSWILKFNSTLKDKAEDLDIVMLMYNLLEYSDNYFMAS